MRIAVVGRGLIGSAAARHLAEAGHEVVLIGPDEPADFARHDGVFGSHYDEGRITRGLDPYPFWAAVSQASIARYRQIEAASGVAFFQEVGALIAGPQGSDPMRAIEICGHRDGLSFDRLEAAGLTERFPYFAFPADTVGLHEPKRAGHISPRRLVRAQGIAAHRAGAQIVPEAVSGIEETAAGVRIGCTDQAVAADQVLVAAGGFTQSLIATDLRLSVYARTVAFFEIDAGEAARLQTMPTLIYLGPNGEDPYLLPPIRYPDGKTYLKLGGDRVDVALPDAAAIAAWFRGGGSAEVGEMLTAAVLDRMPGLAIRSVHVKPCVTTYTAQNLPVITRLTSRLSVAVAGCGRGAKCSDELGRLGAETVLGRARPDLALAS